MSNLFKRIEPTLKLCKSNSFLQLITILELIVFYYQNVQFKSNLENYNNETLGVKFMTVNGDFLPDVMNSQNTTEQLLVDNQTTAWTCALYNLGANVTPPIIYQYQFWRLFTSLFQHNNFKHFLTNCLSRVLFWLSLASMVKYSNIATYKLVSYYFLSGILGNMVSSIFLPVDLSIGSSSSIYGLLGMNLSLIFYIYAYEKYGLNRNLQALLAQIVFITTLSFFGLCDHFAHIGGFISGFILLLNDLITQKTDNKTCKNSQYNFIVNWLYTLLLLQLLIVFFMHLFRVTGKDEYELQSLIDMGCDRDIMHKQSIMS